MRTSQLLAGLFALVLALVVVVGIYDGTFRGMYRDRLDAVLADLDNGRVVMGSDVPNAWFNDAKPMAQVVYVAPDGRHFILWGYTSGYRSLNVYICEGTVFAAHYVEGIHTSADTWYFCNRPLYDEYLSLATTPPVAPAGSP